MSAVPHIHPLDVILHKRDGLTLSDAEINAFIHAVTNKTTTEAQIAAFLMAVFQRGLNTDELAALTRAMRYSGETFDATPLHTFTVDKHSTGGVGDKTSLLIGPILAAAGLAHPTTEGVPGICVPMISGRSLGHTGGTLDKLETIPGFDSQLSLARFEQVLRQCGAALIGQTPSLVPADRILYGLRDHTGTVESPFLITASIMSKKLAESLNALVLDVKTGSGAFMKKYEDARFLANLMVQTGEASGTRTVALLTQMDQRRALRRQLAGGPGVRQHHARRPPPPFCRPHRANQPPLRLDAPPRRPRQLPRSRCSPRRPLYDLRRSL
jgi:pyrimidine-nucleoside phosphorylase